MAVAFKPGDTIGRGDLDIFLTNASGNPTNAAEITYALYYVDLGPPEVEVLIGSVGRIPVNPTVGEYYASLLVPPSSAPGTYRIRWSLRELVSSPLQQVVQEFAVVLENTLVVSPYSACEQEMIDKLRMRLRDHNPDKFYRFRPPEHEGQIGQYNRIFGQIWEDQELKLYLELAIDDWDSAPPSTSVRSLDQLCNRYSEWRGAIFWEAIAHACHAVALNWVADEFSMSSDTLLRVYLPDNSVVHVSAEELYDICYGPTARKRIRDAFEAGLLQVETVHPETREVSLQPVTAVLQHHTSHKAMVRVALEDGRDVVCTVDHSLFLLDGGEVVPVTAERLVPGLLLVTVEDGEVVGIPIRSTTDLPPEEHTYDLSVPGPENFVLANGVLAHNSYSIGGVSLDIEKSSKYESLKSNAEGQFDKQVEHKAQTVKYIKGLQQPRFGIGIRSAFGPQVGRGVLSARNFLVVPWFVLGYPLVQDLLHHAYRLSSLFS
jgi:hypothetical protein